MMRGMSAVRIRLLAIVLVMTIGAPAAMASAKSGPITFYFGLKRPDASAQKAFFAVSRPGSSTYRHFLSLKQVSARYGATRAVRRAFVRQIKRLGLTSRIDGSGVFARVSGPVATFDRAFRVRITREFENDPNIYAYAVPGNGRLHLPAALAPLVRDVVPIYAHSASSPDAPAASARIARAKPPGRTGRWTRGCTKAKATGAFSFGQVRHAYRIDRLGAGAGASVAIFNDAEGVSNRDIADNADCFGYPKAATRTLRIDGQTSPFTEGLFEPQEDLAVVRGMAPGLRSLTFTQVWGTPGLWFLGPAQVLDAPHLPDSLSISYGVCERLVRGRGSTPDTRAGADLMDAALARLGIAGVGAYASSGDFGSSCNGKPFLGAPRSSGTTRGGYRPCTPVAPAVVDSRSPRHGRRSSVDSGCRARRGWSRTCRRRHPSFRDGRWFWAATGSPTPEPAGPLRCSPRRWRSSAPTSGVAGSHRSAPPTASSTIWRPMRRRPSTT
jgi:hypothetical protein